ncbi:MAG: DNA repair protein RecN [Elusimicrobiaceae bacterium]|nr:DNA repair protein RecN [Elusimicrobiaceae bacterium]
MLKRLSVKNFAVISAIEFSPKSGLNVFTGETGAGKSVAIAALGFALGARASASFIKDGADKVEVQAEFDAHTVPASLLEKYALDGKTILFTRSLDRKGKGRAFLNKRPVPVAALAEIGKTLVDFHGQHEHQSLLQTEVQLQMLDGFAQLLPLRQQTQHAWKNWTDAQAKLAAAQMSEQEKQRQLDLCLFQLKEIENINPKSGEDVELDQKLPQLKHAGKLLEAAAEAYRALYEDEISATSLLGRAIRHVQDMTEKDESLEPVLESLTQAETFISDACQEISAYRDGLDADPQTLDSLLTRHEKIKRLKLKYGPELSDVLHTAQQMKEQIDRLQNSQLVEKELQQEVEKTRQTLDNLCEQLHDKRYEAAQKLAALLKKEITPLGFDGLEFEIAVEMDSENPTQTGADRVEFLFSPNPGQALRPLHQTASGGELSRVMLGLKTVLAGEVPTMIFDEVDTGIGGRTATLVGHKLRSVAQGRQVLCVTHLATVAACADAHFHIEKATDGKKTEVSLRALTEKEIVPEIARMLGALSEADETAISHARQMLQASRKIK